MSVSHGAKGEMSVGRITPRIPAALAVLAVSLIVAAAFQGSRPLHETTEARYAECARQTLESGDWTAPVLNGRHHWTKPPSTYWAIMAGMRILGLNAWGARAYLIVCAVGTALAVFYLGRRLWDEESGLCGALVYATSPFPVVAGNIVSTDAPLAFWTAAALLLFWVGLRRGKPVPFLLMWTALAMAFFTKGPPSLLPLAGIVPVYWLAKRRSPSLPPLLTPLSASVFVALAFCWYAIEAYFHPGLAHYWLGDETLGRYAAGEFNRNPQWYRGFAIYGPVLLVGSIPWTLMLAARAPSLFRIRRRLRAAHPAGVGLEPLFLLLNIAVPCAVFMVSRSKMPLYLLPLFAPLSLALGRGLRLLIAEGTLRPRAIRIAAVAMVILSVAGKAAYARLPSERDMTPLARQVREEMNRHRSPRLYLLSSRPCYGLQFYLRDVAPMIDVDPAQTNTTPADVARRVALDREAGRQPILLLHTNFLDRVGRLRDLRPCRTSRLAGAWCLLIPRPPENRGIRRDPSRDDPQPNATCGQPDTTVRP